jgi:ABC-type microcin C transport system permease subunit YejB
MNECKSFTLKEEKIKGIMRTYNFDRKTSERIYIMIKDTDILESNFLDISPEDKDDR